MTRPSSLSPDPWLAEILGRRVFRLNLDADPVRRDGSEGLAADRELQEAMAPPVFIYSKVPCDFVPGCVFLESLGFRLVDTNLVFDKALATPNPYRSLCQVRFAEPADKEAVEAMARESFTFTRFHLDPEVPRAAADRIKAEWAGNYFRGKRGDAMVVAEVAGAIAGFNQLLLGPDGTLTVDLIAVGKSYRRKGIAADMIEFAARECQGVTRLLVGTQVANLPSVRLYEKTGFRLCKANYVFHYHQTATEEP